MRGIERPPRWALITLIALIIANVGVVGYLLMTPGSPASAAAPAQLPSASATPTKSADPAEPDVAAEPVPAEPLVLTVYGDGYSAGNSLGGEEAAGWPARVAEAASAQLQLVAVPQAGYLSTGIDGRAFADLPASSPAPASVTVVFGSRNDLGNDPAAVQTAAEATFQKIRAADPETVLVVIGPAWSNAAPPAGLADIRDAVRAAAAANDAQFVDPLAEGWFAEPAGRISGDGISPTDDGHAYLAGLIAPAVSQAADRARAAG
jgi:lysophospholipase L1-like esterase